MMGSHGTQDASHCQAGGHQSPATTLEKGQTYTTAELKINFFKPVWKQRLTAKGRVVKRSRKLAYTEADILDESGSLVAKLNGSCLVLSGDDAHGR